MKTVTGRTAAGMAVHSGTVTPAAAAAAETFRSHDRTTPRTFTAKAVARRQTTGYYPVYGVEQSSCAAMYAAA